MAKCYCMLLLFDLCYLIAPSWLGKSPLLPPSGGFGSAAAQQLFIEHLLGAMRHEGG
jgi:hypothetical protein